MDSSWSSLRPIFRFFWQGNKNTRFFFPFLELPMVLLFSLPFFPKKKKKIMPTMTTNKKRAYRSCLQCGDEWRRLCRPSHHHTIAIYCCRKTSTHYSMNVMIMRKGRSVQIMMIRYCASRLNMISSPHRTQSVTIRKTFFWGFGQDGASKPKN